MAAEADRLRLAFEARKKNYKSAEVSLATTFHDGKPIFIRGTLRFLRESPSDQGIRFQFDRLTLDRFLLEPEQAMHPLLRELDSLARSETRREEQTVFFEGQQSGIPVHGLEVPPWLFHLATGHSNAIGEPRFFDWPSEDFLLRPLESNTYLDPQGPIGNARLGVYSNPTKLIDEFIHANLSRWPGVNRGLLIILPDYRARFLHVDVRSTRVVASLECGSFDPGRLFAKATIDDIPLSAPLEVVFDSDQSTGRAELALPAKARAFQLYLLDSQSDDMFDWVTAPTEPIAGLTQLDYEAIQPAVGVDTDAEQAEIVKKLGVQEAELLLRNARDRFESGAEVGYTDCKANCRSAMQSLIRALSNVDDLHQGSRKLAQEGLLGQTESEFVEAWERFVTKFAGLASKKGSHPPLANEAEARLTLEIAEALFRYLISRASSRDPI